MDLLKDKISSQSESIKNNKNEIEKEGKKNEKEASDKMKKKK